MVRKKDGITLSVVVPATNAPETLEQCIAAIARAADPPEEIIVVEHPRNRGPAGARNLGARRATMDVLVFVDADVEVAPEALKRIRDVLGGMHELAAVFGSYDDEPADEGVVSSFRNLLHHHVHQNGAGPAATFWAGLGAIRRDVFISAGGFDEQRFLRPSIEDIDLGMRLSAAGHRIILDPTIQGKHLKRWTLPEMVVADFRDRAVPWLQLLLQAGVTSTSLNLGWRHRLSAIASVGICAALAARRPPLAGVALGALLFLNHPFYRLVFRQRGFLPTAVAIPLHVLHHVVSTAAVPVAVLKHVAGRRAHPDIG